MTVKGLFFAVCASASAADGIEALTLLHLLCTSTSGLVQLPHFSVGKLKNGIVPYILEILGSPVLAGD